jgi:toxin FitB
LPFDDSVAIHFVDIMIARRRSGKPIEILDALIAAVARAHGAAVATRDIGGFAGCGVTLVDPWTAK